MPSQLLSRSTATGSARLASTARGPVVGARSSLLWPAATVARWAASVAVGGVLVVGCWYAVGGEAQWGDQRNAMSLAIGATVLTSFASLSLLLTGRRAVGLRRVALLGDLPMLGNTAPVAQHGPSSAPSATVLVGSDGRVRYHRADCSLAVGREYPEMSLRQHEAAGRVACGVCRP